MFVNVSTETKRRKRPLIKATGSRFTAQSTPSSVMTIEDGSLRTTLKIRDALAMEWSALAAATTTPRLAIGNPTDIYVTSGSHSMACFRPKFPRPCTALSWNTSKPSLIAACFLNARDYCVQVWDVEYGGSRPHVGESPIPRRPFCAIHPIQRLEPQRACFSTQWLASQPMSLAVGTDIGRLKIYDTRVGASRSKVAHDVEAHANGVPLREIVSCPNDPLLLATCGDDRLVKVWDLRRMDAQIARISIDGLISQITWLPRGKVLLSLTVEEPVLCAWDVESIARMSDKSSSVPTYRRRVRRPLACVDKVDDRFIGIDWQCRVSTFSLRREHVVSFSSQGHVAEITKRRRPREIKGIDDDVQSTMKRRAAAKYGLDAAFNASLFSSTSEASHLFRIWTWLARVSDMIRRSDRAAIEKGQKKLDDDVLHRRHRGCGASDMLFKSSQQEDGTTSARWMAFNTFRSARRDRVLECCGWVSAISNNETPAAATTKDLERIMIDAERRGEYGRSAALALFHCHIRLSVDALHRGITSATTEDADRTSSTVHLNRSHVYSMVLMILVGYSSSLSYVRSTSVVDGQSRNRQEGAASLSLWRSQKENVLAQLDTMPYLRAICLFLKVPSHVDYHDNETNAGMIGVQSVLRNSSSLRLSDTIALAVRFLPNPALRTFVSKQVEAHRLSSDVESITLLGLGENGLGVLQRYLDRTSDLQSVALLRSQIAVLDVPETSSVGTSWFRSYRELLNTWRMWHARASLDVALSVHVRSRGTRMLGDWSAPFRDRRSEKRETAETSNRAQLQPCCQFCNHALFFPNQNDGESSSGMHWTSTTAHGSRPVMRCCPNCKKPLPRCAICLVMMGTPNPTRNTQSTRVNFDEWWAWCRHCGHGGHAGHLDRWFSRNTKCPVANCDCDCATRDRSFLNAFSTCRNAVSP